MIRAIQERKDLWVLVDSLDLLVKWACQAFQVVKDLGDAKVSQELACLDLKESLEHQALAAQEVVCSSLDQRVLGEILVYLVWMADLVLLALRDQQGETVEKKALCWQRKGRKVNQGSEEEMVRMVGLEFRDQLVFQVSQVSVACLVSLAPLGLVVLEQ